MRILFALALMQVAALCCLRAAQPPQESWDNLAQLRAGEDIEVVDARMKSHRGRFLSYTGEGIALRDQGRDISVARTEVASVKRRGQARRGRNALIGLAVGAAAGLAIGAIAGKTYHEEGETPVFILVWTPIGAGAGAAVGAALPSGRAVTVYRAGSLGR